MGFSTPVGCVMYLFLDEIPHRYSGSETLALAGVSFFVRADGRGRTARRGQVRPVLPFCPPQPYDSKNS